MSEKKISRVVYFDILNILACFAVIALHHNGIVHNYDVNTPAWKQALAFEVLFYWAVPVFFMLSGATLLDYRSKYTTQQFFTKRVLRAVIPFLIWSFILLLHSWVIGRFSYKNITEIFNAIITTKVLHGDVYWFFIPLIALYCFIPVLSLIKDNKSILWYMVFLIFVTHSCLPVLFNLLGLRYNFSLSFPTAGYVIFLLLGYLFSQLELSKKQRVIIYILGITSALVRYFGTIHYSLLDGKVNKIFFSYMQFHSVLLALAIFVFVKYTVQQSVDNRKIKLISQLSSCSLGIYLIHKLVMSYELYFLNISADNPYWRFLGAFMTYGICLIIVLLGKRIPYIKAVFP